MKEELNPEIANAIRDLEEKYKDIAIKERERTDLTHLRTYTIDDIDTIEIDDAISLERLEGKEIIWIHIADSTEFIEDGGLINNYAKSRSSSVYLKQRKFHMLPKGIINLLSLRTGKINLALSVGVELRKNGAVDVYKIVRSYIKVRYRLTYQEADDLIDLAPNEEKDLFILSSILTKREYYRRKKGAIILDNDEGRILIEDNEPVLTQYVQTKSRKLVSESMILMGSVIGEFGQLNSISLPYRRQDINDNIRPHDLDPQKASSLNESIIRSQLNKSYISSDCGYHHAIGVDAYVQATSPIRRYLDMVVHRQIICFIESRATKTKTEIDILLKQQSQIQNEINYRVKLDNKEWIYKWLQKKSNTGWSITIIKIFNQHKKIALIHFTGVAINLVCKLNTTEKIDALQSYRCVFNNQISTSDELSFNLLS